MTWHDDVAGETYPELMRSFNLQMAKGALEEKLADTGMSIEDLEPQPYHPMGPHPDPPPYNDVAQACRLRTWSRTPSSGISMSCY